MKNSAADLSGGTLAVFTVLGVVALVLLVVTVASLWRVFTKAGEPGWKIFIPVYNAIVLLRIAGKSLWWLVPLLIPGVGIIASVFVYIALARRFGRDAWFGVGLALLGFAFLPVLAFGAAQYSPDGTPVPARTRATADSSAPWITSLVAAVVLAVLVVTYFLAKPDDSTPAGSLTGDEQAAMAAAGTEAANLATYTRKNYEKDFARALDGITGGLRSDISKLKTTTLQTMTTGKFDLYAKVRHTALVGRAGTANSKTDAYVVLVAIYGYTTTSADVPNPQNLQVTMQKVKGKWLASDVKALDLQ